MDYCRDKEARARHATVKKRNFLRKKCKSAFGIDNHVIVNVLGSFLSDLPLSEQYDD